MILYYSGTGNSRFAASIIARETGDELICMNDIMRDRIQEPFPARYNFQSEKPFVIVSPTYCWRIPRVVEKFLRDSRLTGSKDVYFYMTCGTDTGSAYEYSKALCEELGYNFMGMSSVKMPENYITMFKAPDYDEAQGIIRAAVSQIESAGRQISFGKPLTDPNAGQGYRAKLTNLNDIFYKLFVNDRKYYVTDACIGCGSCVSVCPTANISMEDGEPVWHGNCTQCMACIATCPKEAIEYGTRAKGKRRYYLYPDGTQKKSSSGRK